jgi:hypothetical protein
MLELCIEGLGLTYFRVAVSNFKKSGSPVASARQLVAFLFFSGFRSFSVAIRFLVGVRVVSGIFHASYYLPRSADRGG